MRLMCLTWSLTNEIMSDAVDVKRSTTKKHLRGQAPPTASSFLFSVLFLHEPEFGSSMDIVSGYDGNFSGFHSPT